MNLTHTIKQALKKSMSYESYRELMAQHTLDGTHTGAEIMPDLAQFSRLNHQRMKRLDKTMNLQAEHKDFLVDATLPVGFLVITESWCGDAAQTIPMIHKVSDAAGIALRLVLRDENPNLMDQFLTGRSRSIAKLIMYHKDTHEVLETWGPRPEKLTQRVQQEIKTKGSLSPAFKEEIQLWYNKDKGKSTEADLMELLKSIAYSK